MGFIQAFKGALSASFANQWKDYYVPAPHMSQTVGLIKAVPQNTNAGRGENGKGSDNIISNGSKIVVPEGMGLITVQDGAITGFVAEPGGFIWQSDDPNSKSIFAGDGILASTLKASWEQFKFGGQPGSQQLAFYVNLNDEIPGVRFGTDEVIYWNDSFFETKVGANARGEYSIKIVDPLAFVKWLPSSYLLPDAEPFDFNGDDEASNMLFKNYVSVLTEGITKLSMEAATQGIDTYNYINANKNEFSDIIATEVENKYQWKSLRGLDIVSVNQIVISYDEATTELLKEFQQDDKEIRRAKRMGAAYSSNMTGMMASATGEAMKSAAANENGSIMGFMGMNMAQQSGANVMGTVTGMQNEASKEDPTAKLLEMKKLLDAGAITEEDYEKLKKQILGL